MSVCPCLCLCPCPCPFGPSVASRSHVSLRRPLEGPHTAPVRGWPRIFSVGSRPVPVCRVSLCVLVFASSAPCFSCYTHCHLQRLSCAILEWFLEGTLCPLHAWRDFGSRGALPFPPTKYRVCSCPDPFQKSRFGSWHGRDQQVLNGRDTLPHRSCLLE